MSAPGASGCVRPAKPTAITRRQAQARNMTVRKGLRPWATIILFKYGENQAEWRPGGWRSGAHKPSVGLGLAAFGRAGFGWAVSSSTVFGGIGSLCYGGGWAVAGSGHESRPEGRGFPDPGGRGRQCSAVRRLDAAGVG